MKRLKLILINLPHIEIQLTKLAALSREFAHNLDCENYVEFLRENNLVHSRASIAKFDLIR